LVSCVDWKTFRVVSLLLFSVSVDDVEMTSLAFAAAAAAGPSSSSSKQNDTNYATHLSRLLSLYNEILVVCY